MRQVGQRIGRVGHEAHIGSAQRLATVFRAARSLYSPPMSNFWGGAAASAACSPIPRARGGRAEGGGDEPPPARRSGRAARGANRRGAAADRRAGGRVSSLDELLRRGRSRFGGGGGGLPGRPDRSLIIWAVIAVVLIWLVFTSFHSISPGQRGVVTRFGRYSCTLGPGVSMTLPSPIDRVKKIDVENIRTHRPRLGRAPTI